MNHDIAHCPNTKCSQASTCWRSTIHVSHNPGEYWWYSKFAPDKKTGICNYYWPFDTIEFSIQTTNPEEVENERSNGRRKAVLSAC